MLSHSKILNIKCYKANYKVILLNILKKYHVRDTDLKAKEKKWEQWDGSDSIEVREIAWYMADPVLSGVIPECRKRSNPWASQGIHPKILKKKDMHTHRKVVVKRRMAIFRTNKNENGESNLALMCINGN